MKKLPKTWFIDVRQIHPLLDKFKKWFNEKTRHKHDFNFIYYGKCNELFTCYDSHSAVISLQEWHDCVFGQTFEKGEEVLVRDSDWKDTTSWVTATFVAEFEGKFVVDWDESVYYFDQCKKKPSELDLKIEELKKLAEKEGVKVTVICE